MDKAVQKKKALIYAGTILMSLWLIFLHLVLSEISLLAQLHILGVPLILALSYESYKESKFTSFMFSMLAMVGMLMLFSLTLIALIGD